MEGWDTYYLGANLPVEYILEQIREKTPDVLGIATTTLVSLHHTRELITRIRGDQALRDIQIIVGGKVYNENPELAQSVGADAYASSAIHAIQVANQLLGVGRNDAQEG